METAFLPGIDKCARDRCLCIVDSGIHYAEQEVRQCSQALQFFFFFFFGQGHKCILLIQVLCMMMYILCGD